MMDDNNLYTQCRNGVRQFITSVQCQWLGITSQQRLDSMKCYDISLITVVELPFIC
ncbi:hypothetical protein HOLleu_18420 [Holothuria leucospilota]|uniref:Uncharacterized protein n=1 Tax=Holothuria leucospilota TaxID=206669 RepID=A0A9Q1H938_HOLLE|nr:hypothetical protein HOLleu_18420 [Holothuria leucospilota]